MLKKILSYFIPLKVYQKKSGVSKNLEVTWNNGQLVLDSKNTNYSYGSLQRILKIGLKKLSNFQRVSLLGSKWLTLWKWLNLVSLSRFQSLSLPILESILLL